MDDPEARDEYLDVRDVEGDPLGELETSEGSEGVDVSRSKLIVSLTVFIDISEDKRSAYPKN